jgi:sporulation protein YlmC with PRC-barrel domain
MEREEDQTTIHVPLQNDPTSCDHHQTWAPLRKNFPWHRLCKVQQVMNRYNSIRLAIISLTGAVIIPVLSASNVSSSMSYATENTPPVAAVRAAEWLGRNVVSTDGVRVGNVADYVLQFGGLPQLRYVIVKSGGGLGKHGDERAIPADAITLVGQQLHVSLALRAYNQLPALPANHRSFLSFSDNLATMAKLCSTPLDRAELTGNYTLFSDLNFQKKIVGRNGEELGTLWDLWIDFNANDAPFFEIVPTVDVWPFNRAVKDTDVNYEIPTTAFESLSGGKIHCAVGETDRGQLKLINYPGAYVAAVGEKLETVHAVQTKAMP